MSPIRLDDAELFYALRGTGAPAFVLVHGGLCDARDWDRLVPLLAADHAVLVTDLRAHGRSTGDVASFSVERCAVDLHALIDALGLAPAILVGHSFAARIVAETAQCWPKLVAGLVLLDGSRAVGGYAAAPSALQPMRASLADAVAATIGPHLTGADRERVAATMLSASPALMAASVAEIERWDRTRADAVFAALPPDLPVLALQSTYHDQATPRRSLAVDGRGSPYLDFLRGAVPQIETRILPGTGHFAMLERPDDIAEALLGFAAAIGRREAAPTERTPR